eukprot:477000-Prorocentrum_minimum.AAC.1
MVWMLRAMVWMLRAMVWMLWAISHPDGLHPAAGARRVDVKGNGVDVKGNGVDVRGYFAPGWPSPRGRRATSAGRAPSAPACPAHIWSPAAGSAASPR